MIRAKHSINGVGFVPVNRDSFSLQANFPDEIGSWENDFTAENRVVLPQEAYLELLRHLNDTGVQEMPRYNIGIDNQNNDFFVDLYENVSIAGSMAEISIKNFVSKDNIKSNIDNLTFEYLKQSGKITDSDMVNIPFVVIPDDIGAKILNISMMIFVIGKEVIDRAIKLTTRIGDLIAGTTPSVGVGVVYPTGALIRFGILIAMDVAILALLIILMMRLIKQAMELLNPPIRFMKGMTVDRLLTIGLAEFNVKYQSSLLSEFKRITLVTVPIDFKKKKFFQLLLNEDSRVLNRGYPTSSDTTKTVGMLIDEICKMFNIQPRITNNILRLEPRQTLAQNPSVALDHNFNNQDTKEHASTLDMSRIWNTKIISYLNDSTDKLLYDNPKGLRVEYKTVPIGATSELTVIKGFREVRINFALATIKEETKLDEFLERLAKASDNLLNTSFMSKINNRKGVMAISQEQFSVTKLIYQVGGKQTADYVKRIGAGYLGDNYHAIDESNNSLYRNYSGMPIRMDNEKFNQVLQNNLVTLEGLEAQVSTVDYLPEMSSATVSYKVKEIAWASKMKTIKVYEE